MTPKPSDFVFVDGRPAGPDRYVFLVHEGRALEKERYRPHVLLREKAVWKDLGAFKWQAVALVVQREDPLSVLVLGRDGDVGVVETSGAREEKIDPKKPLGPMRGMERVKGAAVAFGMKREVYRRMRDGQWERFNAGMPPAIPKLSGKFDIDAVIKEGIKNMGGINSIVDGDHTYAFGMRGEIWTLRGQEWKKVDSPTNLMLTDATAQEDGTIVACGIVGTIIEGRGDQWRVVEHEPEGRFEFSSIESFKGTVYLADGQSLQTFKDGELETVDFHVGDVVPSSRLRSGHGQLLSIAGEEVFSTQDGKRWVDLLA